MKTMCIIQARIGSTRLPGKAMTDICGRPMLAHIIDRLKAVESIQEITVATTHNSEDDVIVQLAEDSDVSWFRGPVDDVLTRIVGAAKQRQADVISHVSSDNPLLSPEILDDMVKLSVEKNYDFMFSSELPLGLFADVYSRDALMKLSLLADTPTYREHINAYIFDHVDRFNVYKYIPEHYLRRPELRLTVDTAADLELIRSIYGRFYSNGKIVDLRDVIDLADKDPELFAINSGIEQIYVSEAAKRMRVL